MRKLLILVMAAGLMTAQEPAGAPAPPDANENFRISETFKFVLAPVTVTDKSGNFISGLTPLDFRLFDNGKLQRINEDVATHPISLVVAIQASSVMEKILPQIQKTGSLFDGLVLGESGEIAILGFDHRIQTMTGFTSEPGKITEAMKKLKIGSTSSRLNDASMQAINMLRNRPANRKRILLLISESRDNGSEIHVRDVLTAAEFANVVIYSVDVSHFISSLTSKAEPPRPNAIPPEARHLPGGVVGTATTDSQMNMGNWMPAVKEIFTATKAIFIPNPLEVFTRYSGGREYSFATQRGLEHAISDIGEDLHTQYLLTYSPNNQTEAGFHEIEVQVLKPDMKVRTRNGYWLAAKPE